MGIWVICGEVLLEEGFWRIRADEPAAGRKVSVRIVNRHVRTFDRHSSDLARYIDLLGSAEDRMWPAARWPAMVVKAGLTTGAAGGHGPIRYVVERYEPGRSVMFRFTRPHGWRGTHRFLIEDLPDGRARFSHELRMEAWGASLFQWLIVFRPLHDTVIEEAFDRVAVDFGEPIQAPPWSRRVRLLRWVLARSRRKRHVGE